MNAQEFKAMQNEFADVVTNYEDFLKKGYIMDLQYNVTFMDVLDKINYAGDEINLLKGVIAMVNDKKSQEEIDEFIEKVKTNNIENLKKIEAKHNYAKKIVEVHKAMTQEKKEEFYNAYKEYVKVYHPAVKVFVSEGEVKLYNLLKQLYFENNMEAFTKLLNDNKDKINFKELSDADIIHISETYYNTRIQLSQDVQKRKKSYPFGKGDIFADEIEIAKEEGELKTQLHKINDANKAFHEELIKVYGKDLSL